MNGYSSQRAHATVRLMVIQMMTRIVWPMRKRPVPRKRAMVSEKRPKASGS
jgi:hypothetical protein